MVMISKEEISRRTKVFYLKLNIFRVFLALAGLLLYIVAFVNKEPFLIINKNVTIAAGLIATATVAYTYVKNYDKNLNYYVWKIRKK